MRYISWMKGGSVESSVEVVAELGAWLGGREGWILGEDC